MKLYSARFARRSIERRIGQRTESRDAVVWDIDRENQICRVKIQGSDNLIAAHFPRNWKNTPYWLRRGNAVQIRHRAGVRGYVEVIGEGRAIPSPVAGSALPDPTALPDMVLTGMLVLETSPASMSVITTSGTYRIDGVVYAYDPSLLGAGLIVMDVPAPMIMGSGAVMQMGSYLYSVELDAAPSAGFFRYDLICIGADGELDYIAGTPARTDPQKPLLPADHVALGYILVRGGATSVTNQDINGVWRAIKPAQLVATYESEFAWDPVDDTPTETIKIEVRDQYGNLFRSSFTMTLTKPFGSGELYSAQTGWDGDSVSQAVVNGSSYTFTYRRDQAGTEHSPVFVARAEFSAALQASFRMDLLDSDGDVIY